MKRLFSFLLFMFFSLPLLSMEALMATLHELQQGCLMLDQQSWALQSKLTASMREELQLQESIVQLKRDIQASNFEIKPISHHDDSDDALSVCSCGSLGSVGSLRSYSSDPSNNVQPLTLPQIVIDQKLSKRRKEEKDPSPVSVDEINKRKKLDSLEEKMVIPRIQQVEKPRLGKDPITEIIVFAKEYKDPITEIIDFAQKYDELLKNNRPF